MKNNSLAATNIHLKQANAGERLAVNIATSTAVETGKPARVYIDRYHARLADPLTHPSAPAPRRTPSA